MTPLSRVSVLRSQVSTNEPRQRDAARTAPAASAPASVPAAPAGCTAGTAVAAATASRGGRPSSNVSSTFPLGQSLLRPRTLAADEIIRHRGVRPPVATVTIRP